MTSMAMLEDIVARIGVKIEEVAKVQKEVAEMQKEAAEMQKKAERRMDRLDKNVGGLNNSVGEIIEMIVIPGVKEKMNELNHDFTIASPNRTYSELGGKVYAEVDLLLENCTEVMAVEVKMHLSLKWVNRHLERLELLRKKENATGLAGRTMYAAVAGIKIDEEARELAASKGMYLIEIDEDSERIKIISPAPEKIGTW